MSMHTSSSTPSGKVAGAAQAHAKAAGKPRGGAEETGGSFLALINGLSASDALSDAVSEAATKELPDSASDTTVLGATALAMAQLPVGLTNGRVPALTPAAPAAADVSEIGGMALSAKQMDGNGEAATKELPDSASEMTALGATALAMAQLPVGLTNGRVPALTPAAAAATAPISTPASPAGASSVADADAIAPTAAETAAIRASAPFAAFDVVPAGLTPIGRASNTIKLPVSLERLDASGKAAAANALVADLANLGADPSSKPLLDRMDASHPPRPVSASALSSSKIDAREVMARVLAQSLEPSLAASTSLANLAAADMLPKPAERWSTRAASGSGFEGVFGVSVGAGRSDAGSVYDIAPSAAVVPDTAVAETVSYWVSQGVQSAQLTLDGFGNEPVEVSIVLNGDQAQVDFRTNQADVRQVLEAATSQLKEMLSNQGLQLTGMSVGMSGSGNPSGEQRQQKPPARQMVWPSTTSPVTATRASANTAVGSTLDLFV